MFERAILERFDPAYRIEMEQALVTLSRFGLWEAVEKDLILKVATKFHQTEDVELLKEIRLTQEFIKTVRVLQEVGMDIYQEKKA